MGQYIIRRLLLVVVAIIGVSVLVFFIVHIIPGGVENAILGEQATPDQFVQLRHALGLDQPLPIQYVHWAAKVVRGDLGDSLVTHRSISSDIRARLPVTFELGLISMIVSIVIALPIGILSAVRQDTGGDYAARSFAIGLLAVPGFWIGTLVITFGARWFGYAPPLTYVEFTQSPFQNLQILLPAAIILGAQLSGRVMRQTRTQMLEVLRQDYIRTAWAKGLKERAVVFQHAMRNAALPVITIIGVQVPILFGGTVILEQIFSLPGVGRYLITAVNGRDYPVIQGVVLLTATVVIFANMLVDLSYALLDPRIRYS